MLAARPLSRKNRHSLSRFNRRQQLWEQIQLAQAHLAGKQFTTTRFQTVRDEDGVRRSVEVPKRVRAWWWNSDNGIQVKQAIADVVHKRATYGYRRV